MVGVTLKDKYKLGKIIGSGAQAIVFEVSGGLVAKFSPDTEVIAKEINVIKKLNQRNSKNVVKCLDYDLIVLANFEENKSITCGYYIMPRYEELDTSNPFKVVSDLVTAFEWLHSLGKVHNDIKPSNVMMDSNGQATLIDFGLSEKYALK